VQQHRNQARSKDRRRLLAAVCAAVALVSACSSNTTTTTVASGPVYATQDPSAVSGGTLTVGVWQGESSFLNAGVIANETFSYLIDAPVAEGLLWYRSTNETAHAKSLTDYYQPWLATEIPTLDNHDVKTSGCPNSAAKMCVTWKLRSGVQWHDGSFLSSKDVCDTYNLFWLKYASNNPTQLSNTSVWSDAVDCKQVNNLTATIDYDAQVGTYLSLGTGVLGILPAAELDPALATNQSIEKYAPNVDLGIGSGHPTGAYKGSSLTMDQMIDGTGPYVFSSATTSSVTYVKNQNYWNKRHMPHIDKVVFKFENDLQTEVTDAQTGAIDMGFDMRAYNLQTLETAAQAASPKLKLQIVPEAGAEKIDLNLCAANGGLCGSQAWLSKYTADPVIRKALLEGINRQAIVDQQVLGMTTIPKDSFLYLGADWIGNSGIPQTAYNVGQANSDLDKAGYKKNAAKCGKDSSGDVYRAYKDGTCLAVNLGTTKNNPSRVNTELMIQGDLAKIGIKVVAPFTPNENDGVFFGSFSDGGPLYNHKFDMAMYQNTLQYPGDPDSFLSVYHGDCGGSCTTGSNDSIPSAANQGNGQNDTGLNDPVVDAAFDDARSNPNLANRAADYAKAETQLAKEIPEIPLYQQILVNSYPPNLRGFAPNDLVWDYNLYDWYCAGGTCQA
jgi:ABC-type transport system substrate-binding protein